MGKRILGFLTILAMVLSLFGCSGAGSDSKSSDSGGSKTTTGSTTASGGDKDKSGPKRGGVLRLGMLRDPAGFDPVYSHGISNIQIQGQIYETLVKYETDTSIVGALAERWEQPDDRTYIFHLRKGVKFHDGTTFGAEDVVATIDRWKNPASKATRKQEADSMESYQAVDEHTVKVVLKAPSATFLHALASHTAYIVSADDIASGMDFETKTNGTGPFILTDWEPQARYEFKANPDYWREGFPYLDGLVMVPIQDERARVNALRSGEVDMIEYVPWQEFDALARDFQLMDHQSTQNLIRINSSKPPVDNKLVRQALQYIIDRDEVHNLAFGGKGEVITGPLQPKGSPFYFADLEGRLTKDWDKAKALLKEAGYNSPADVPPIELTVASIAVHSETAQVVQKQLTDFGLNIVWKTVEVATMTGNRSAGTYVIQQDGLGMTWPDPDYLRSFFHSKGTSHATGAKFKNEELDRLLEQGLQTIDTEKRKAIYRQAEEIILDESPWIFLFWRPGAEALAPYVKNYVSIPAGLGSMNQNRFEEIWLDK